MPRPDVVLANYTHASGQNAPVLSPPRNSILNNQRQERRLFIGSLSLDPEQTQQRRDPAFLADAKDDVMVARAQSQSETFVSRATFLFCSTVSKHAKLSLFISFCRFCFRIV